MGLRAREVDEVRAARAGRHAHQVHLGSVGQPDGGLLGPPVDDSRGARQRREPLDRGPRVVGLDEDIQVADRLAPAAERSRRHDAHDRRGSLQAVEDQRDSIAGPIEQETLPPGLETSDARQDLFLGPGGQAAKPSEPAAPCRQAEALQVRDAQASVEQADGLRPEAGDAQQVEEGGRELGEQALVIAQPARLGELLELVRDRLPDPGDLGRVPTQDRGRHGNGPAADGVRGTVVGHGLEDELALDLEQVPDLVEDSFQLAIRRRLGDFVGVGGRELGGGWELWACGTGRW